MDIRFDDYMANALYGADGFYSSGRGRAGRRGADFITSPEVGPLFGEMVGRWLDEQWHQLGEPTPFRVIDLGAGPGTLVKSIERATLDCSTALMIGGSDISSDSPLPDDLTGIVVLANELLDNVPFQWLRAVDGELSTAWVVADELVFRPLEEGGTPPRVGAAGDFPWLHQASMLIDNLLDRGAARILAFDYGARTTAELAERGDWLRCYRGHHRSTQPLVEPGHWDITTDVAVDQLPTTNNVRTQAQFLDDYGIDELVEQGRAYWRENASAPSLRAFEMRSRVNEADALRDPDGLGSFLAMEW